MTAEPPEDRPAAVGVGQARDIGTSITGSLGPIYVRNYWYATSRRERRGALALDLDHERNLAAVFVPPEGWERARRILAADGMVLLAGELGIGRRTAAWQLLDGIGDDDSRPIQVLRPEPGSDGGRVLDAEDVVERDRLLLDLSDVDDQLFEAVQDELTDFFGVVAASAAVLVVLLPSFVTRPRSEFRARTALLERPDGRQVLYRRLREYGIAIPAGALLPDVANLLTNGSVGDVAELASLIREARSDVPDGTAESWFGVAVKRLSDRDTEISQLVAAHPSAADRALLLSVALLAGADAATVLAAEERLLRKVRHTVGPAPDFERSGLGARLTAIGGRLHVDGRVAFTAAGRAAAVLNHFWTHFPSLRNDFARWVIACGDLGAEDAHRETMVARFVEQSLAVGRPGDVFAAVAVWAGDARVPALLASAALEYGLTSVEYGWAFRRRCYEWATDHTNGRTAAPARLADLLVAACRRVIVQTHPEQAIVRLRHLTRHPEPAVAREATTALVEVVGSDRSRMRYLLTRLTGGRRSDADARRADARLFLTTVVPELLVARGGRSLVAAAWVHERLAQRWGDVFDTVPAWEYVPAVHRWLSVHAAAEPADAEALAAVLIAACDLRFDRLSILHSVSREWARTPLPAAQTRRRETVERLYAAVDAAAVQAADAAIDPSTLVQHVQGGTR
ncbi:hypothetical protein [Pseudonocardia kunmingensis]|uniref:Uncharacterized protein n=1 Tax=Pseudonocardia kunmingensis TaxID=630975 RepID=A0A543DR95_9PSEU|nr:hypothetical protein [Pseudonocardia kunmingensis]TQM11843.1 hypothetical protein FB558_4415 [Pseudonocardia kunmingensis]